LRSKYIFAERLESLSSVAEKYKVDPQVIEQVLDKYFDELEEYKEAMEPVDGKRFLRVVKMWGNVAVLQLARKRGRGFSVLKDPWHFVFKR